MDAALWLTRDYLRARKQFGQPLAAFQALQHRMADMLIETELARSMLFQALAALEASDPATRRRGVSATKVQNAEAGMFVGGQAIQLHGAIGMTEEYVLAHLYKLLFANARQFGGPDLHLERFIATDDRPMPDGDKR
jgi:alkylation response protein AidB-like acyl-CoA dehydrogenase